MSKYIIIAALVVLGAGSFIFYKTHTAMVSSGGEVAALQSQYESAIAKNKEVFIDQTIAAYAKMRHDWLTQRRSEVDAQKSQLEEEDVAYQGEIERLTAEYESLGGVMGENKNKLEVFLNSLASHETLNEILGKAKADDLDIVPMESSDPNLLQALANNLKALDAQKEKVAAENKKEKSAVEVLEARKAELMAAMAEQDALVKERRSRVSPKNLDCHVATADPNWDYVIIDGGVNKGIVIGSRLAVMRGGKKICELSVTLVENNRASCDVVYSTLVTGEAVHPGDVVVAVRSDS